MGRESGTRSGLLWQVERILVECKENGLLPNILIMENVPEVKGSNNIHDFTAWVRQLERLGYSNYCDILNAKDYGIPQNRKRCFMVSILGEYNYKMPKTMKLKYKLKDFLEKEVSEKYYLSDKIIEFFRHNSEEQKANGNGFEFKPQLENNAEIGRAITTRAGGRMDDNFILTNKDISFRNQDYIAIKNATKEGYLFAEPGDGIDISGRMQYHRGNVQKGKCQTISCKGGDNVGVVVKDNEDNFVGTYQYAKSDNFMKGRDRLQNGKEGIVTGKVLEKNTLRIRKLTPKECWRLMGVLDKDSELVKQSDSSKYHLAGDSIVSTCLMGIFGELLGIDYKTKIDNLINNLITCIKKH